MGCHETISRLSAELWGASRLVTLLEGHLLPDTVLALRTASDGSGVGQSSSDNHFGPGSGITYMPAGNTVPVVGTDVPGLSQEPPPAHQPKEHWSHGRPSDPGCVGPPVRRGATEGSGRSRGPTPRPRRRSQRRHSHDAEHPAETGVRGVATSPCRRAGPVGDPRPIACGSDRPEAPRSRTDGKRLGRKKREPPHCDRSPKAPLVATAPDLAKGSGTAAGSLRSPQVHAHRVVVNNTPLSR